jgi:protein arginine kinase
MIPERFRWMSEKIPYWLKFVSPVYGDIIISVRNRVARNIKGHKFPLFLSDEERKRLFNLIADAISSIPELSRLKIYNMEDLEDIEKEFLLERHLISFDLFRRDKGRGVAVDNDEKISIMINEEDHLRIQVFYPGLQFEEAFVTLMEIEEKIGEILDYTYSDKYGFLTSCPTNAGTGYRVSCLLHLPASVIGGRIEDILKMTFSKDITVRGYYGEGTEVLGNMFQFASLRSLGRSEEEILSDFKNTIYEIMNIEKEERDKLLKKSRDLIEDRILRTIGILKNAKLLNTKEVMEHTSNLRMGVGLNIINMDIESLNEVLLINQPAHIQILFGKKMAGVERDKVRVMLIRSRLNLS